MLDVSRSDEAHVDERLRTEIIAWLATVTTGNRPHAVPVWFAWSDPCILIFSLTSTRKVADLRRQPECTIALESANLGTDIVIAEGSASLPSLDDATVRTLMPAFEAKYRAIMGVSFEEWLEGFQQPILVEVQRITAWNQASGELDFRVIGR